MLQVILRVFPAENLHYSRSNNQGIKYLSSLLSVTEIHWCKKYFYVVLNNSRKIIQKGIIEYLSKII